jgi:hypothetical protein
MVRGPSLNRGSIIRLRSDKARRESCIYAQIGLLAKRNLGYSINWQDCRGAGSYLKDSQVTRNGSSGADTIPSAVVDPLSRRSISL